MWVAKWDDSSWSQKYCNATAYLYKLDVLPIVVSRQSTSYCCNLRLFCINTLTLCSVVWNISEIYMMTTWMHASFNVKQQRTRRSLLVTFSTPAQTYPMCEVKPACVLNSSTWTKLIQLLRSKFCLTLSAVLTLERFYFQSYVFSQVTPADDRPVLFCNFSSGEILGFALGI